LNKILLQYAVKIWTEHEQCTSWKGLKFLINTAFASKFILPPQNLYALPQL